MRVTEIIQLEQEEKRKRLIWSVTVRFLVIFIILVLVLLGYVLGLPFELPGILTAVTIVFLYNIVSHYFYAQRHHPAFWPYLGIILDMAVITLVVHYTGGISSIFLPLYLLQIVGTNVHFSKTAGPINFLVGGGSFVALLAAEYHGTISVVDIWPGNFSLYNYPELVLMVAFSMILLMGLSTYRSGYVVLSLQKVERKLAGVNEELVEMNKSFIVANKRLRELDQLKTEFISVASHQLRTPLSAIKWVLKMVMDGDVGPISKEQKELLEKGYQSNERMIGLINDLLNVSRIEEERFQYRFVDVSLIDIIDRLLDETKMIMDKKSIFFERKVEHHIPLMRLDPQKMHLAIQNLLDNAIKYTPDGGKIVLTVLREKNDVVCSVQDSGVGIPDDQKDRVFSKFFRGDNVIRMQTQGTGLGLFISRSIIEKHKGTISFESQEGKGTSFTFRMPIDADRQ